MILARVIGMLGPIDLEMLEKGQESLKYFTEEFDLYHINEVNILHLLAKHQSVITHINFVNMVRLSSSLFEMFKNKK